MPYVALLNGNKVFPYEVSSDARVECIICGGEMLVQEEHRRDGEEVPRVFAHIDKSDCGGESEVHKLMKAQAMKSLRSRFPKSDVTDEIQIGDDHIADVVCTFDTPRFPLGNGLIVEAQYKNKDKDFKATVSDFTEKGYSVYWAYWPDFKSDEWMEIDNDRLVKTWPTAAPDKPGLDGYNTCVRRFFDTTGYGNGRVPMTLPKPVSRRYVRSHVFNFVPPSYMRDRDFKERGQRWLHGKGTSVVWGKLFEGFTDDRTLQWVLEVTQLNKRSGEKDTVGMHITDGDIDSLYTFTDKVTELKDNGDLFYSTDSVDVLVSTPVGSESNYGCGAVRLLNTQENGLCTEFMWGDAIGNTRSLRVNYREGDIYRFEDNICALLYSNIN